MREAPKELVNAKLKKGDFNDYAIRCVGKKVTITVNGVVAIDGVFDNLPEEGIIAFQVHSGGPMEVVFKNIEFREFEVAWRFRRLRQGLAGTGRVTHRSRIAVDLFARLRRRHSAEGFSTRLNQTHFQDRAARQIARMRRVKHFPSTP